MRHVGGLGRRHRQFVVRRDRHALRLDADVDLLHDLARGDIDDRGDRIVLVGDVEALAVARECELLGIRARRQVVQLGAGRRVEDLHRVVVAGADVRTASKSAEKVMPRGRLPTLIVRTTSSVPLSMTETVLSFSFDTNTSCADAAPSWVQSVNALSDKRAKRTNRHPGSLFPVSQMTW